MADTKILNKSTGVALSSAMSAKTNRQIVKKGDATVITPGNTGYDVIQLKTPALDTTYTAATLQTPILLGVDDIKFTAVQYPPLGTE
jgi:hypothetical protein